MCCKTYQHLRKTAHEELLTNSLTKKDKFLLEHLKAMLYLLYFLNYTLPLTGIALPRSMVMYLSNSGGGKAYCTVKEFKQNVYSC